MIPSRTAAIVLVALASYIGACAGPSGETSKPTTARSEALPPPEARSLLDGRPLRRPTFPPERAAKLEADLAAARAAYDADPQNEDAAIWYGRRLAYLGRYREAIEVFTLGLRVHPDSPRLLRHRGHRYITVRELDRAWNDLERAADLIAQSTLPDEVEADGAPNAAGIPRSTLHSNIYYHLALVAYLRGEFGRAASIWDGAIASLAMNDDTLVAFAYWRFNAQTRLGNENIALAGLERIRSGMDVIENHAYYRLLLVFKGELGEQQIITDARASANAVDVPTTLYGIANRRLTTFDLSGATSLMEEVIGVTDQWPAFGYIASEIDLRRLRNKEFQRQFAPTEETIRDIQQQRQRAR